MAGSTLRWSKESGVWIASTPSPWGDFTFPEVDSITAVHAAYTLNSRRPRRSMLMDWVGIA